LYAKRHTINDMSLSDPTVTYSKTSAKYYRPTTVQHCCVVRNSQIIALIETYCGTSRTCICAMGTAVDKITRKAS